jgi:predicted aspartyl protease
MSDVFISYARENEDVARRLYYDLKLQGIEPWLDQISLLPGQNWRGEIKKSIRKSRFFLALLSSQSVDKRGYAQKELREALDILDEVSENDIYIIPVRLDECLPTIEKLHQLQWLDIFPSYDNGFKKLLATMNFSTKGRPESLEAVFHGKYGHLQSSDSASPQTEITLSNPHFSSRSAICPALIDTGAETSAIPKSAFDQIGELEGETVTMLSYYDSTSERIWMVNLNMQIGDHKIEDVHAVVIPNISYAIIGRDVLKNFIAIFDGAQQTVTIYKPIL